MSYEIFPADNIRNQAAIVSLWSRNLSTATESYFEWFVSKNPNGPPLTILALDSKSATIIGSASTYPAKLSFRGSNLVVGIAANFNINQQHRVFGPSVQLQRALTDASAVSGFDLNFAFPNNASKGVFSRIGYSIVGNIGTWTRVLRYGNKIRRYIRQPLAARIVGTLLDMLSHLAEMRYFLAAGKYKVEMAGIAGSEFDNLWNRIKNNYRITLSRDSAYLNWRYIYNSKRVYRIISLRDKVSELCGYAIIYIDKNTCTISEIFTHNKQQLEILIYHLIVYARKENVESLIIGYIGRHDVDRILSKHLFTKRSESRSLFVKFGSAISADIQETLLDVNQWYAFEDDIDL